LAGHPDGEIDPLQVAGCARAEDAGGIRDDLPILIDLKAFNRFKL
jgi:hypothetical protein